MLTLVGQRVNLRQFLRGDGGWLGRAASRGSWWRWDAPWAGPPSAAEIRRLPQQVARMARERLDPPRRMVIETAAARPVGTVSRYWVDVRTQWLEVGVGIYAARDWGRGYGTEALALWVDYLFARMPLERIGLRTWSGNARMIRLARRLGFVREATFREAYTDADGPHDRVAFGLLRREWRRLRRRWPV